MILSLRSSFANSTEAAINKEDDVLGNIKSEHVKPCIASYATRSTIVSSGVVIFFLSPTLQTQGVRNSVVGWQHGNQKIKEHQ